MDGKVHELKTWPEFYQEVESGAKTFEVRENDRDFKVGDVLWLREYTLGVGFSGRSLRRRITYVTDWKQQPRYVVLALSPLRCTEPGFTPELAARHEDGAAPQEEK